MKTTIVAVSVVLLLAAQGAQADKVYRWVDAEGVVHYGATPPPGQAVPPSELKYQRNPDPEAAQKQLQQYQETADKREKDQLTAEKASAEKEKEAAERAEKCTTARSIVDSMNGNPGVRYEQEDGSYARFTEDARDEKRAEAQAAVDEFCD